MILCQQKCHAASQCFGMRRSTPILCETGSNLLAARGTQSS